MSYRTRTLEGEVYKREAEWQQIAWNHSVALHYISSPDFRLKFPVLIQVSPFALSGHKAHQHKFLSNPVLVTYTPSWPAENTKTFPTYLWSFHCAVLCSFLCVSGHNLFHSLPFHRSLTYRDLTEQNQRASRLHCCYKGSVYSVVEGCMQTPSSSPNQLSHITSWKSRKRLHSHKWQSWKHFHLQKSKFLHFNDKTPSLLWLN